jgi:hypothetical protein
MSAKLPTTPEKLNSCSCGAATSAAIVKSGESQLDHERLYHKEGSGPRTHNTAIIVYRNESMDAL